MPEPITVAAITTLALNGLGRLANAALGAITGNLGDRGFQSVMQGIRDRLAGMRDAPDGLTVARAVRVAEMQALERVLRDYEKSLWLPRVLRSSRTNEFIEQAIQFCASSVGRSVELTGTLDVEAHTPLVAAANEALALPPTNVPSQERANRLTAAADSAVLDELRRAVQPVAFPRGFEEHFRRGNRGFSSFSALFSRYLQQQLESNEAFHRVYSTALLARIEQLAAGTHEAVKRVEAGVDLVRADMRAGIADSRDHLAAGDTLNFATTDTYFGRRLSSDATFNHARPLVGREDLVTRIVKEVRGQLDQSGAGIVAISAIGGAGKSRLLLEVVRRLEPDSNVRWVRDGVDVTPSALSQLPPGPLLLICDDAQRRSDLTSLLRLAEARRDRTAILVSTRPYGRDALRASVYGANISYDRFCDLGDLPDVPADDLVPLLEEELGSEHRHLARDLLRLAGNSILVALVAARLLRTRQLDPRGILLDPEFRTSVLEGFRQEAVGALPGSLDPEAARRALETLAAVQPISLDDEELEGALARYVGVEVSVLRRTLGALVDGGVVRAERSGYRIVPDILGDHILNSSMVARGRPTALDAEILDALGAAVLVNLVRNVAELDWQRSVAGQPSPVFGSVWESFTATFRTAPNWKREEWLSQLHPVAAFQPKAMLQFAKRFLEDPRGDDRSHGFFNVRTSDAEVVRKLPPLLAIIAQHPEHTVGALDLLWTIGRADDRPTNPYPDHAIRQLADVVAYSRRRHVWMQERALDALERWLTDPRWSAGPHSPLLVANAVLQTSMMEHSFNDDDNSVTMTRMGVHAGTTRAVRLRAIAILERLMAEGDVRGRHLALTQLLEALRRPDGAFGHEVSVDEEESFRDQYGAALDAIERIIEWGTDPLALVTIRSNLNRSARFTLLPWKEERMRSLAEMVEDSPATRQVRALGYAFREWEPERASYEEYQQRWTEEVRTAVDELVEQAGSAEAVARALSDTCDLHDAAAATYEPAPFLHTLAERHPDVARDVAAWSLEKAAAREGGHPEWLAPLLTELRVIRPSAYEQLLKQAAASDQPPVRWAAAAALCRVRGESRRSDLEFDLIRTLMADSNLEVLRTSLTGLAFMELAQVAQLLPLVTLRGDVGAAEQLAEAWVIRQGEELPQPDEATTRHLLAELLEVPDLDRAQWAVSRMLSVMARLHPEAVIDFLSARVERERAFREAMQEVDFRNMYDAIPFQGFDGLQEALRSSERYEAVVERLLCSLNTTADGVSVRNDVAHTILGTLGQWDDVLERIVRRWIANGDCERLRSSAALFEELPRDFVLTSRPLVVDLLAAAETCGQETRSSVEHSLELCAFGNDYVVRTDGEPHPMTLRIASEAEAAASELSQESRAGVAAFYARLAARAAENLELERRRDEEARRRT